MEKSGSETTVTEDIWIRYKNTSSEKLDQTQVQKTQYEPVMILDMGNPIQTDDKAVHKNKYSRSSP